MRAGPLHGARAPSVWCAGYPLALPCLGGCNPACLNACWWWAAAVAEGLAGVGIAWWLLALLLCCASLPLFLCARFFFFFPAAWLRG